jgi:hypothetical protein
MLETLLALLKVDVEAPEIILEEDGDLGLSYFDGRVDISIAPSGCVAWAIFGGKHGSNLNEFIELLKQCKPSMWE